MLLKGFATAYPSIYVSTTELKTVRGRTFLDTTTALACLLTTDEMGSPITIDEINEILIDLPPVLIVPRPGGTKNFAGNLSFLIGDVTFNFPQLLPREIHAEGIVVISVGLLTCLAYANLSPHVDFTIGHQQLTAQIILEGVDLTRQVFPSE